AWVARVMAFSAVLLALLMIGVCVTIAWMGRMDRLARDRFALAGVDVTRFIVATSPRLTGDVVHPVQAKTVTAGDVMPGSVVLLDEGVYSIRPTTLRDVALVGVAPE